MVNKRNSNDKIELNYRFSWMKKSTSLLGTTLAMGTFGGLLDGDYIVQADSIETIEDQLEADKLETVEMSPIKSFSSQADFVYKIGSLAQVVADEHDLYASIMVAQAILESSWGNSGLASYPNHNLYGIKGAYQGQSVIMRTWEHFNGKDVYVNAAFRKYPSYKESLYDNAFVLKNTSFSFGNPYYAGAWKSNSSSYRQATAWLTGRYATDPNYGSKLNNIIERYNLTAFDTLGSNPNVSFNGTVTDSGTSNDSTTNNLQSTTPEETVTASGSTHSIKAGDTLFSIARKYGVSLADLRSWNQLSGDTIYVGKSLVVSNNKNDATTSTNQTEVDNEQSTGQTSDSQYKVVAGDTLFSIARKQGVSVAQLQSWNNLTSDKIFVGQTLKINGKQSTTPADSQPNIENDNHAKDETASTAKTHQVTAGDTLYSIARKYGVSVDQIKSWNNVKNELIYVGQTLSINNKETAITANDTTNQSNSLQTSNVKRYTVKANDTLYRIAKTYGITMEQLKARNALKSDVIYVGQTLKIDASSAGENEGETVSNQTANVSTGSQGTYTVVAGDTLFSIASKHGLSVENLQKINNLRNHIIHVGQKLKLKVGENQAISQTPTPQTSQSQTVKKHEVAKGDTLYSIAKENKLTVKELKELNNLTNDAIYIGQTLKLK